MNPTTPPPPPSGIGRRDLLLGVGAIALPIGPAWAASEAPRAFIQKVGERTVEILQRPGAQNAQRLDELVQLLNDSTDLDLVGRLVLGQYWRQASEAQRSQYLALFRELVVKTMADRLNTYSGETFEITGSKPIDERDTVVSTRIVRPAANATPIAVDWRVRDNDGRMAIIDIVAEGVSMVVTQRSEVGSVVSQKGMDGLIATMKDRLQRPA